MTFPLMVMVLLIIVIRTPWIELLHVFSLYLRQFWKVPNKEDQLPGILIAMRFSHPGIPDRRTPLLMM